MHDGNNFYLFEELTYFLLIRAMTRTWIVFLLFLLGEDFIKWLYQLKEWCSKSEGGTETGKIREGNVRVTVQTDQSGTW